MALSIIRISEAFLTAAVSPQDARETSIQPPRPGLMWRMRPMFDVASHVRAVLLALQFEDSRTKELQTFTDGEWQDLLFRWDFRRCIDPLRQTCGDALPESVRLQNNQSLADNAQRLQGIKEDYSRFSNASRLNGEVTWS